MHLWKSQHVPREVTLYRTGLCDTDFKKQYAKVVAPGKLEGR